MLALSTDAVPALSLEAVEAACRGRGLDGAELVLAPGQYPDALVARARAAQVRVVALRVPVLDERAALGLARASHELGVPVSVASRGLAPAVLDRVLPVFEQVGGRLLLGHRTDLDEALAVLTTIRDRGSAALGAGWEVEPSAENLDAASAVLFAMHEELGMVRLHGGGPEQRDQDGRGVGPLLGELALSGYAGPIVLCPSSREPAIVERWARWAELSGATACGHAVSTREHALDMREVEPRARLDTILFAYRTLIPGATLRLTLDHDPSCMYYTLEATEPADSFAFRVVENGPETWRAEVTKH